MLIRVADRGATYPLRIDPLIQQGKKLTGTGAIGDPAGSATPWRSPETATPR